MTDSLRIIELRAENFKRIKAVRIQPGDQNVVVVAGKNGQGKTSVLDAITAALAGIGKDTPSPIRNGTDQACIKIDLGELRVERIFSYGKSHLKVTTRSGSRLNSPRAVLDQLLGKLSFDPLAFAEAPAREQVIMLTSVLDLDVDLDKLAADRETVYTTRTEVNREVKALSAKLEGLPPFDSTISSVELSAADLLRQHEEIKHNETRMNELRELRTRLIEDIESLKNLITEKRAQITAIEQEGREIYSSLNSSPSSKEIRDKIEDLDQLNIKIRINRERGELETKLANARLKSSQLTERLTDIDAERKSALERAGMPYPGLEFTSEGVTLDGVPFTQASGAERLRVSTAIAMRANPNLRIVRIADGSLLDEDSMAELARMAEEHDFQIWIERVSSNPDGVGVFIEDGEVISNDPQGVASC